MRHIDTTQSKINHIKKLAKKLKKEKDIQLSKALEEIAKELGYENYHHATVCLKKTQLESNHSSDLLSEEVNR